jgi:hypothetical protein
MQKRPISFCSMQESVLSEMQISQDSLRPIRSTSAEQVKTSKILSLTVNSMIPFDSAVVFNLYIVHECSQTMRCEEQLIGQIGFPVPLAVPQRSR